MIAIVNAVAAAHAMLGVVSRLVCLLREVWLRWEAHVKRFILRRQSQTKNAGYAFVVKAWDTAGGRVVTV